MCKDINLDTSKELVKINENKHVLEKNHKWNQSILRFVFTINNYTDEHFQQLEDFKDKLNVLMYSKELGETRKTPHLQGYAELKKYTTFRTLKKYLPTAHLEPAYGTYEDNLKYISKQNEPYIYKRQKTALEEGIFNIKLDSEKALNLSIKIKEEKVSQQGKRTDLDRAREWVLEGKNLWWIAQNVTSFQALRFAETLMKYKPLPATIIPKHTLWFVGSTGTGKSAAAHFMANMFPIEDIWISSNDLKWFDGYYGQKIVVLDDFGQEQCDFRFFLRLLDRYPLRVPVKGGFVPWCPEQILITSVMPPERIYPMEDVEQLYRRIIRVNYNINWEYVESFNFQTGEPKVVKHKVKGVNIIPYDSTLPSNDDIVMR